MNGKQRHTHSFNWAYLISQQKFCISRFQMSWERKMFLDTITQKSDNSGFITEKLFLLPIDSFRWFLLDNKQ
jgi:hypothetical protein